MSNRKQIARAFRLAKERILLPNDPLMEDGKHEFICNAIDALCQDGKIPDKDAANIVQHRIWPHTTLNSWVVHNVLGGDWSNCRYRNMQEYRHRWLDELIREFSTEK